MNLHDRLRELAEQASGGYVTLPTAVLLGVLDERERLRNELIVRGRTAHYANPVHDPMRTFEECSRSTCKGIRAVLDAEPLPSFGQQIAAKGGQLSEEDETQIASGG